MAAISRSRPTLPPRFVLYWTVATAMGLSLSLVGVTFVGVVVLMGLSEPPTRNAALLIAPLALALTTPLGISQWLVLRRARLEIRLWIPATTIGFIVGLAPLLLYQWLFLGTLGVSGAAAMGALLGAPIGFAQWLILRRRVKRSGLWILGTIAASATAVALDVAAFESPAFWSLPAVLDLLLPVLPGSALFGATTGLLFRRLVADSRGGE